MSLQLHSLLCVMAQKHSGIITKCMGIISSVYVLVAELSAAAHQYRHSGPVSGPLQLPDNLQQD